MRLTSGENYGPPEETGWKIVTADQLNVGDEVIMERRHIDHRGYPAPSDYYRMVVGEHRTVAGPRKHLTADPNVEFPHIPAWGMNWVYASNDMMTQMWRRV